MEKEILGNISSIESMGLVDGPGIRYVVFLQGCELRCLYCHNRETWDKTREHQRMTPEELVKKIVRVKSYFGRTGGVTFSGGECMLQADALEALLRGCREAGIQTAVDTAGNVPWTAFERILPLTDIFLYDIKCLSADLHQELTGVTNERILENYRRIYALAPEKLMVRVPVIPGANDQGEEMQCIADFLAEYPPESVELLPYHRLGIPKANALGAASDDFEEPTEARMNELKEIFAARKLMLL